MWTIKDEESRNRVKSRVGLHPDRHVCEEKWSELGHALVGPEVGPSGSVMLEFRKVSILFYYIT